MFLSILCCIEKCQTKHLRNDVNKCWQSLYFFANLRADEVWQIYNGDNTSVCSTNMFVDASAD